MGSPEAAIQLGEVHIWQTERRPALAYRQCFPSATGDQRSDVLVVLLHGLGDSSACFSTLVEHLPAEWAYVALDWRGHGYSDWLPDGISGYSQADHVLDLVFFVKFLRSVLTPHRVFVVAHSLGAATATVAAALGGLAVDALVQLEQNGACGMYDGHFCDSQGTRMAHAIETGLQPPVQRRFATRAKALEWTVARHMGDVSPGGRGSDEIGSSILKAISKMGEDGSIVILSDPRIHAAKDAFFLLPRAFEQKQILPKVSCPVLFIHAEDGACTRAFSESRSLPSLEDRWCDFEVPCRLCMVPSGGHYPHIDQQTVALVAGYIVDFIREVRMGVKSESKL